MRDFTLKTYSLLLETFRNADYTFTRFDEYIESGKRLAVNDKEDKICILRHDVDRRPANAYVTAKVENGLSVNGTYYFRYTRDSFNAAIINSIAELGHEIGYHYETMDTRNGDVDKAYDDFCRILEKFREIYPVKTICMHGSPRSKYHNTDIWKNHTYTDLGIIGEPYLDIDFNQFAYLTDTGRMWNGSNVSVRDKVKSNITFNFKSTTDIIDSIDKLPSKIMFTLHPERWNDSMLMWLEELVSQNIKNVVKKYFFVKEK